MTAPLSVLGDGMVKVTWVPTIAAPTAPTATALNGATAIDLSCYLTADGFTTNADEQTITDDRLCTTQSYEKPGRFSYSMEVAYVFQPQAPTATDNKAQATLAYLTTGFIVVRWGLAYTTAYVAAQIVDVYPVQAGKQIKQPPEANTVLRINQHIYVVGTVNENVAVV